MPAVWKWKGGEAVDVDKHQAPGSVAESRVEIDWIRAHQIRILFDQAPAAIFTSLAVALIAVAALWAVADHLLLTLWAAALLVINIARVLLLRGYRKAAGTRLDMAKWERRYFIGALAAGVGWGSLGFLLDTHWPVSYQLVVYILLLGVPSGALASNGVHSRVYLAFAVPVIAPISLTLAGGDEPLYATLSLLVAMYLVMLISASRGYQRNVLRALSLIRENDELLSTVTQANEGLRQEVEERQRAEQELREMTTELTFQASHDSLTELINRREFEHRLHALLGRARKERSVHLLLYMDLDQFKIVNDTCGHSAGDELLRQLSVILSDRLRASDTLGRLGGDEFGVLLDYCPVEKGMDIANDLRRAIKEFRFAWEDKSFEIGVSVGVVAINERSESVSGLLSAADVACYVAKDLGRNRVHVYRESDIELARRQGEMRWISRINHALDAGRLELYYQEIVPLGSSSDQTRHVEILIRMLEESGDLIPPNAFIPAAERYGLMPTLDRWVVKTLFTWLNAGGFDGLVCSINLSGTSLSDDSFLDFIREQFEAFGVSPGSICFEITETAAVADLATASAFIKELRAVGCSFSLDDFGSGLSSFGYLRNLPVDFLKIDGSFVRDLAVDPVDYAMVESIHSIGHVMGKKTIAEFVENEAIRKGLEDIGVDFAQGYLFGKPRSLAEFENTTSVSNTATRQPPTVRLDRPIPVGSE